MAIYNPLNIMKFMKNDQMKTQLSEGVKKMDILDSKMDTMKDDHDSRIDVLESNIMKRVDSICSRMDKLCTLKDIAELLEKKDETPIVGVDMGCQTDDVEEEEEEIKRSFFRFCF